jgi:RNA polymerase sigma-70 factor (ECF subfamily)
MSITSNSLLLRLQTAASDADWRRLVDVYAPVVRGWLNRYQLQPADADDLVQDVLGVLVRELPTFRHSGRTGAFRHWLRVVAVHRVRNFWRTKKSAPGPGLMDDLAQLEDAASDLSRQWDAEHDKHVVAKFLDAIENDFEPTTWRAFRRVMFDGAAAADVAAELGITPNAVWIAKSRVLHRLRQEAAGLLD